MTAPPRPRPGARPRDRSRTCARTTRARRSSCGSGGSRPRPEAVAFRYYDGDGWQGDDVRRGRRHRRARSPPGWSRAAWCPGIGSASCRRPAWSGCCATSAILLAGGVDRPDLRLEHRRAVRVHRPRRRRQDRDGRGRRRSATSWSALRNKLFTVAHLDPADGRAPVGLTPPPPRAATATLHVAGSCSRWRSCARPGRQWGVAHPGELDAHAETVAPESMFTIIYTSGTTGVPKGVVLTHENLVAGVCSAIRAMQIVDDRRAVPVPAAGARARARARMVHDPDGLRDGVLARHRADQGGPGRDPARRSWPACRASSRSSTRA